MTQPVRPNSPESWLPVLLGKLQERNEQVGVNRAYARGKQPLPEMGEHTEKAWRMFQSKARLNYGGLAVEALKARIRPQGVRAGDRLKDVVEQLWRDNRLSREFSKAITDRLETGYGYLVVQRSKPETAYITSRLPENTIVINRIDLPGTPEAALIRWTDDIAGVQYAGVYTQTEYAEFSRVTPNRYLTSDITSGWTATGRVELVKNGAIPIIELHRPQGSLLENHHEQMDSIVLGKLQRMVITAMQAFKQRGIKGDLPTVDKDGNAIDWAKVFEPAPGALWDLPAGIDVWESQQTDIRPLLDAERADRRDFAALTRTPLTVFIPEGANQSAEGAAAAKESHVALAEDEIADIGPELARVFVRALEVTGHDFSGATIEVDFEPPALVSLSAKYAAAAQAANVLARETIQREILGFTPQQIAQDEAARLSEQLAEEPVFPLVQELVK